ncbi:hypothetical protein [Actinoallomurus iriomotensis]|uniref:Uncharacterized protein n=1 Tax=Actinoallomurus iriomotensis TaxID=478107 RepID=A0A9W6VNT8_9ACTN|nr:hypothetical protein [Actinoallomurus iriomotensis]GLY73792.1 hypothetical protein Airi01_020590 [Actinoallomurus iriomotensis]
MSAPNLQTDDASVSRLLASLQTQIESMNRSMRGVEDVNAEVNQHFKAAASTAYQNKISDWEQQYANVIQAYQDLCDKLHVGYKGIDAAHGQAASIATGWGEDVYNALTP